MSPRENRVNPAVDPRHVDRGSWSEQGEEASLKTLPLYFIENRGQVDPEVLFYEQGLGHVSSFTRSGVMIALTTSRQGSAELTRVALRPVGMSAAVEVVGEEQRVGRVNYLLGRDAQHWKTQLPTCGSVVFRAAYPGIDLRFYGNRGELEYDVLVTAGADPSRVRFEYDGITALELTREGDLAVRLPGGGRMVQRKPIAYQIIEGERRLREGSFRIEEAPAKGLRAASGKECKEERRGACGGIYGIDVASYDPGYPLVIDPPMLIYSSFLSGGGEDYSCGIALDNEGNIYVAGETDSTDLLGAGPFVSANGGGGVRDAFVLKLDPTGSSLLYATYLGGSDRDKARAITVDQSGSVYLTGLTYSDNFPLKSAYRSVLAGWYDAFVAKLDPSGALVYSSYLGGSRADAGNAIACDAVGNAYVTGSTDSADFPMAKALQPKIGGRDDAFVSVLDAAGASLLFSSYLGGAAGDVARGIAVDKAGNVYVTGHTASANFPVKNPLQQSLAGGSGDAFLVKLNPLTPSLLYATYLGGKGHDAGWGIAVDDLNQIILTGSTSSTDFPLHNPLQAVHGGGTMDAFVVKIDSDGAALLFSTYLGGSAPDYGYKLTLDAAGDLYVAGETASEDFPLAQVLSPKQRALGDAFVVKLNASGSSLLYSTLLGGIGWEWGSGIAVDGQGNAYLTGPTSSTNFPVLDALQPNMTGLVDAFLAIIRPYTIYTLTSKARIHGAISPAGEVKVKEGSQACFTLMPENNYRVADVLVDELSKGPFGTYCFENVTADHTITAVFDLKVHTVKAAALEHGTIQPAGEVQVKHGKSLPFVLTADANHHAAYVELDGFTPTEFPGQKRSAHYTLRNVTTDHTVVAGFSVDTYAINATAWANGSINPSGRVVVEHGADRKFTVTAVDNYHVADVIVDGVSKGPLPEYLFQHVTAAHSITATFALNSHTILASAGEHGSIDPMGEVVVVHGYNKSFNIIPDANYHVADVKVDGLSVGAVKWYPFEKVTEDHTIEASFAIDTHVINATAWANGSIYPSGKVMVEHGTDLNFTILPDDYYHVEDVMVNGASKGPLTEYTFTNVTANQAISARFDLNTHTFWASAGEHGRIDPSGAVEVKHGFGKAFNIIPDDGYHVADVKVDGVSIGAVKWYPFENVTEDHTIEATFAINTYVITATAWASGSIDPSGKVNVDHGMDLTFTLSPNPGYSILDVLVDQVSVGAVASYTLEKVAANHTILAKFKAATQAVINNNAAEETASALIHDRGHATLAGASRVLLAANSFRKEGTVVSDVPGGFIGVTAQGQALSNDPKAASAIERGAPAPSERFAPADSARERVPVGRVDLDRPLQGQSSWTIKASAGNNGQIFPSGSIKVPDNGSQIFAFKPALRYHVADVLVDGASQGSMTGYSFNRVTTDHVIKAKFIRNTASDYLVGTYGVPNGDWKVLRESGLDSVLVGEGDFERAKAFSLNKIYSLGVGSGRTWDPAALKELFDRYCSVGDAYGYYLYDEVVPERKSAADRLMKEFGLVSGKTPYPAVGLADLAGYQWEEQEAVDDFNAYEMFLHHYPLMRRMGLSLPEMLRRQAEMAEGRRKCGKRTFMYVQSSAQQWYTTIVDLNRVDGVAAFYPDGQTVRMLIHYAFATGAGGYFLFNANGLDGESSNERLPAVAQAILETKPFRKSLASDTQSTSFFSGQGGFYGTIVQNPTHDLLFLFASDSRSYTHPTVKTLQVPLGEVISSQDYLSVHSYSPTGLTVLAGDTMEIPQDHALILIASKGGGNLQEFQLEGKDLELYAHLVRIRAEALHTNLLKLGLSNLPPMPALSEDPVDKINKLMKYIDEMNEIKRDEWVAKSTELPIDGEVLNDMYWNGILTDPFPVGVLNLYYDERR